MKEEEETTRIEARSDENKNTKEDNLKRSTEGSRQRTPRKRKAGNTIFGIPETTNEISRPLSAPSAFELILGNCSVRCIDDDYIYFEIIIISNIGITPTFINTNIVVSLSFLHHNP